MYVRRCFQLTLVTAWTILIPCVSLIFASEGTAASARSSKTSSAMRSPFKVEPFQESFPGAAAGTSENRAAGSRTLISLRQAQTFTVNDLNNDGFQDIVVADFLSDALLVVLGEGGGRFRPALVLPAGRGPRSVLSRDIDGDGVTDLVVANFLSGDVTTFRGKGDGTFRDAHAIAVGAGLTSLAMDDLDRDGVVDLVAANVLAGDIVLMKGTGLGSFEAPVRVARIKDVSVVVSGDVDVDGYPDIVALSLSGKQARILYSLSPGQFSIPINKEAAAVASWALRNVDAGIAASGGAPARRLRKIAGDGQTAHLTVPFEQPLKVEVIDADGRPRPGEEVSFSRLLGARLMNDGEPARLTDDSGRAAVELATGTLAEGHLVVGALNSQEIAVFGLTSILEPEEFGTAIETTLLRDARNPLVAMQSRALIEEAVQKLKDDDAAAALRNLFRGMTLLSSAMSEVIPRTTSVDLMQRWINQVLTVGSSLVVESDPPLPCDVPVTGTLTTATEVQTFTFDVTIAPQKVHISLAIESANSSLFTPGWRLLNPAADPVVCDGIFGFFPGELDCRLGAPGSYTVEVMDIGVNATGTFSLHLQRLNATAPRCGGTTTCDVAIAGLTVGIDRRADTDIYSVAVSTANQKVHISLAIESANSALFTPGWRLLDPGGDPVTCEAISDFAGGERDCGPLAVGSYAVEVMDTGLNATGTYSLHLQRLNAAAPRCGGALQCDVPISGAPATLDRRADTDIYGVAVTTANQKVHISLAIESASSSLFTPGWRLLDPAGDPVTCERISDFAGGERDCGPLAIGSYAVEVMDTGLNATGTYSLHLQRLNATAPRCGGTLQCDVPISGTPATLDRRADTDIYSFAVSTANQKVHISLAIESAISALFTPGWRLLNPAGDPVTCERISDFARGERDCGPLAVGSYAVEVMDTGLDSTGTYSLHLQRLNATAPRCGGTLSCDVPISGTLATLDRRADTDIYSFAVSMANQKVHISLAIESAISALFTPGWRLLNPAGDPVTCERISDFARGERDCGPLAVGAYAVEVMDTGLDSTGTYSLHLQPLDAGSRCGGGIPCGVSTPGTIEARADTDLYSFNTIQGGTLSVRVVVLTSTGGLFNPAWRVVNPFGDPIACGLSNEFVSGTATCVNLVGGSHAVEVMDLGLNGTGTYSVTVSGAGCAAAIIVSRSPVGLEKAAFSRRAFGPMRFRPSLTSVERAVARAEFHVDAWRILSRALRDVTSP